MRQPTRLVEPAECGTATIESPIGAIGLEADAGAVTRIWLPGTGPGALGSPLGAPESEPTGGPAALAAAELREYFAGRRRSFSFPFRLIGTPFQREVWTALGSIPFGETVSYRELAEIVGRPNAFRAVGQANGANPIPIALPCHRVIAADGSIGGYGGGVAMKRALLAFEGVELLAR